LIWHLIRTKRCATILQIPIGRLRTPRSNVLLQIIRRISQKCMSDRWLRQVIDEFEIES